jgi:hypothetical protein
VVKAIPGSLRRQGDRGIQPDGVARVGVARRPADQYCDGYDDMKFDAIIGENRARIILKSGESLMIVELEDEIKS